MSTLFYMGAGVAYEEKRAWIMAVVSAIGTAVYLIIILGRAGSTPVADVPYVSTLLWTVGAAIVGTIVITIAAGMAAPGEITKKDQRDREIDRFGEYIGQSFVVIGGVAGMVMAMAELDYFWIANVIYLCFALSAILGSIAKIVAYRRGFQTW